MSTTGFSTLLRWFPIFFGLKKQDETWAHPESMLIFAYCLTHFCAEETTTVCIWDYYMTPTSMGRK